MRGLGRAVALGLALGLSAACTSQKHPAAPPPQITLTGARLQSFRGGVLVATGRAASVTYQRTNGEMTASEALLRFPSRGGGGPKGILSDLEVRAPTMVGNLGTKRADGMEGVTVKSAGGLVAETERAHFDGAQMTASGQDPVTVDGPDYSWKAKGFFIWLKEERAEFGGPVSSRLGGGRR